MKILSINGFIIIDIKEYFKRLKRDGGLTKSRLQVTGSKVSNALRMLADSGSGFL